MTGKDPLDTLWSDRANWTSDGLFGLYRCAADPRAWVPKRVGIGYTINLAHRQSWFLFGGFLVVAMAPLVVQGALGPRAPEWLLPVTLLWPIAIAVIALVWLSSRDKSKQ